MALRKLDPHPSSFILDRETYNEAVDSGFASGNFKQDEVKLPPKRALLP
ncbi:MAG: hypothetical protein HC827_19210 [Cyanobacteria bacterium RM1_2_2]|nr:hypothetical protein [Cyanobacteria bacterium RM1_2_2]